MRAGKQLSGRDRLLVAVVPLILVLIASLAVVRYHRVDQSSWQGIGFGMFSTYEYRPARTIRVTAVVDGTPERVTVPADLSRLGTRVLVAPGDPETRHLADEMLERTEADRVVVEVWGHGVDTDDGLKIGFRILERVTVP